MRSMGESLRGALAVFERANRRYNETRRLFFEQGGACFTCRDTGIRVGDRKGNTDPEIACPDCELGVRYLVALRDRLYRELADASSVTPRALPLETLRCANAERVRSDLLAWSEGWREGWRAVTPHDRNRPFLLLHGPTGSGKTSAAATLALAVARRQLLPPSFTNAQQAVEALRDRAGGRGDGEYEGDSALDQPGPLIVDDLGIVSLTDFTQEFHYAVIHKRYERKYATILTTNAPVASDSRDSRALIHRIGDRSYWRIMELADVVEVSGYNWRDPRQHGRNRA